MAERRMFAKTIIDSDAFLDMPSSAQALYFHLSMRADDDGFVNNPKKIQRMVNCSDDDLKLLLAKRFILAFESGVIVIKHWKLNNYIRKDRYCPTIYQDEMAQLFVKESGAYTDCQPVGIPDGNQRLTQDRLGKDSIGKDSIDNKGGKTKRFTPPSLEEVKAYCDERGKGIDPQAFIDFYESKGWMVGKNKMKSWKAAVRTWERRNKEENSGSTKQDTETETKKRYSLPE